MLQYPCIQWQYPLPKVFIGPKGLFDNEVIHFTEGFEIGWNGPLDVPCKKEMSELKSVSCLWMEAGQSSQEFRPIQWFPHGNVIMVPQGHNRGLPMSVVSEPDRCQEVVIFPDLDGSHGNHSLVEFHQPFFFPMIGNQAVQRSIRMPRFGHIQVPEVLEPLDVLDVLRADPFIFQRGKVPKIPVQQPFLKVP